MDKLWKQIILGVFLGWIMPQLMFFTGNRLLWREPAETQPPQTTDQATIQTQNGGNSADSIHIPVVDGEQTVMMGLEEYIRGVVLAEMPASFEVEALKAQAVAARTYTLRRNFLGDKHDDGGVCTDPGCCQAYISDEAYLNGRGTQADIDKVQAAVLATAGEVLTYEGDLIEATYFAASGGRTEDAAAVWGAEIPYLQAVDSPGETKAQGYDEQLHYTASEFASMLGRTLQGNPESWLGKVNYTAGGGVDTMVIGGKRYTGPQLRTLLELNSTIFTMTAENGGITIRTKGWGHRVGMSQYGADAMAVAGSGYQDILTYYYQGTQIDKITELG